MSIFKWKPEQEVPEQEEAQPMRPGQRMERDLTKFLLVSLLAFVQGLPFLLGVSFAVATHSVLPLLVAGILGGMIAAPGLCGLVDTVLRSLRDEVGLWWYTYRRAWKQNAAASLLPGALFGLVLAAQIFAVSHIGLLEYPGIQLVTLCLTTVLLLGIGSYLFPLLVLVELPFFAMLKDSLLLFLKNLPRSLGVALILFVFIAAMMLWFPVSAIVLAVGGLWVPVYLACRKIYPILDKEFDLTAAFAQKRQSDTERSQTK